MTQDTLESTWHWLVLQVGKSYFGLEKLDDSLPQPSLSDILHAAIEGPDWMQEALEDSLDRLWQMGEEGEDGIYRVSGAAASAGFALARKLHMSSDRHLRHWFEEIHVTWVADYRDRGVKHPIAPLIKAWFERKPDAIPREYSAGFIPSRVAVHKRKRQAFGLPARIEHREAEQIVLPGFGSNRRMPALPEELLRLGNLTRGGGRGAKLPLRATLAGIEFAPPNSRNAYYTMPVRDFLNRIYPNGYPRGGRWHSELARVAEAQAAARVPYIDPDTGQSGSTIPVLLWRIPNTLDGHLRIAVDLPPKSDKGAPITDSLYIYGASDSRAFYSLLQLAVDWWQPGKTRVPVNKRRGVWTQLTDIEKRAHIERYDPYDRKDIIGLTAPLTTINEKRKAYQRGIETLGSLNTAGEIVLLPDGDGVWRILPPPRA